MSGKSSSNKSFLAAAVGAGAVIGAAGALLYYSLHYIEEDKKKSKVLQKEMPRKASHLRKRNESTSTSIISSRRNSQCSSISGYATANEALNSDDEVDFYSVDSENEDMLTWTLEENEESKKKETELFEKVDLLMKGGDNDRLKAFNLLKEYEFEMSENPNYLWRYAKAHQIQASVSGAGEDLANKKKYIFEGLKYASKALEIDDANPDVHKWFAILTGMQGDFVSIKEKIQNGVLFQKHVLIAIECKPEDYSLHHLLGRFKYEVANVSWFEKKVAASLFGDIPDVSYSDAVADLLIAEELNPTPWKENRLLLARCYIGDGKYNEAIRWLDSAKEIEARTEEDRTCDNEINSLIEKFNKYRK